MAGDEDLPLPYAVRAEWVVPALCSRSASPNVWPLIVPLVHGITDVRQPASRTVREVSHCHRNRPSPSAARRYSPLPPDELLVLSRHARLIRDIVLERHVQIVLVVQTRNGLFTIGEA